MQLVIFLNMEDIRCLAEGVSDTSTVGELIFRALRLRQLWGTESQDVIVLCNETEGRELLRHAQSQCQQAVDRILRAFDLAGVIP